MISPADKTAENVTDLVISNQFKSYIYIRNYICNTYAIINYDIIMYNHVYIYVNNLNSLFPTNHHGLFRFRKDGPLCAPGERPVERRHLGLEQRHAEDGATEAAEGPGSDRADRRMA